MVQQVSPPCKGHVSRLTKPSTAYKWVSRLGTCTHLQQFGDHPVSLPKKKLSTSTTWKGYHHEFGESIANKPLRSPQESTNPGGRLTCHEIWSKEWRFADGGNTSLLIKCGAESVLFFCLVFSQKHLATWLRNATFHDSLRWFLT